MLDFPEEDVDSLDREDAGTASCAATRLDGIRPEPAGKPASFGHSYRDQQADPTLASPACSTASRARSARSSRRFPAPRAMRCASPLRSMAFHSCRRYRGPAHFVRRVERMGIERTERELARADAAIVVLDATGGAEETPPIPPDLARIEVYNKIDLVPGFAAPRGDRSIGEDRRGYGCCAPPSFASRGGRRAASRFT